MLELDLFMVVLIACLAQTVLPETVNEGFRNEDSWYVSPSPSGPVHFAEHFDDVGKFESRWLRSQAKKDGVDEEVAKYDGKWALESPLKDGLPGDQGLVLKSKAKHAAISAQLDRPFYFRDKPLIVQYDITLQEGQECGGAYIKLLTHDTTLRLSQFTDKTPYTIMFGPDRCGNDNKLHFIFCHKNPRNGTLSEKHARSPDVKLDEYFTDRRPHLYTLIVHPDNSYEIRIDQKAIITGTLLDDFVPPVNPPAEIDDPEDEKPGHWDERETIPDPDISKPDGWNEDEPEQIPDPAARIPDSWLEHEPEFILDPTAKKPDDWDDDTNGTWETPLIINPACAAAAGCGPWKAPLTDNPNFKGEWLPPMVPNPNYAGKWRPRRIPNPDFFEDKHPFKMSPIGAVGLELWSMSENILFDNIIITDDINVADHWAAETFELKRALYDSRQESVIDRLVRYSNKRPWLWGVYVVVIGIPAALLVSYLCSSQERDKHQAAHPKKTDFYTEDDQEPLVDSTLNEANENEEEEEDDEEVNDEESIDYDPEEVSYPEKTSPRRRRSRRDV